MADPAHAALAPLDPTSTPRTTGDGTEQGPWHRVLLDLVRAASGGLLFGAPLLYTMEVWWLGTHTEPVQMLAVLGALFVVVLALMLTAGFRSTKDVRVVDGLFDAVVALAVGLVMTTAVLVLLRQLTVDTPMRNALGMVIYESIPFCLGIGVTRFILDGSPSLDDGDDDHGGRRHRREGAWSATLGDLGATAVGATFIGLSIAPTDEIPMLTSAMGPGWLLVMMAGSLVASYAIVFVAGFARQDQRHVQPGIFQHPITETVTSYLIGLLVAALLLWVFQREFVWSADLLARTIVLGFPAAIGGAVGRLAI